MAHLLSIVGNQGSMAFAGEKPWHGLGQQMIENESLESWMERSHTNWTVEQMPIVGLPSDGSDPIPYGEGYMNVRTVVTKDENGNDKIVRSPLGVVGPNTGILQNVDAFTWFSPFIESGAATWETMGALDEFRKVWALAKIAGSADVIRANDAVERYLMLSNSHDGSTAIRVGFTPIRIVCANTLGLAHRSKASKLIRISHAKGKGGRILASLKEVQNIVNTANSEFEATAEQFRILAGRSNINQKDLEKFVRKVYGMDEDCPRHELPGQSLKRIETITQLFESKDKGNGLGTWWDAYNAITEFESWNASKETETRYKNLWFGTAQAKIDTALVTALQLSA
jgi:phage/plasmid-like protein (TIGR03299 family)